MVSNIFIFISGEIINDPIYFSNGLVEPPPCHHTDFLSCFHFGLDGQIFCTFFRFPANSLKILGDWIKLYSGILSNLLIHSATLVCYPREVCNLRCMANLMSNKNRPRGLEMFALRVEFFSHIWQLGNLPHLDGRCKMTQDRL